MHYVVKPLTKQDPHVSWVLDGVGLEFTNRRVERQFCAVADLPEDNPQHDAIVSRVRGLGWRVVDAIDASTPVITHVATGVSVRTVAAGAPEHAPAAVSGATSDPSAPRAPVDPIRDAIVSRLLARGWREEDLKGLVLDPNAKDVGDGGTSETTGLSTPVMLTVSAPANWHQLADTHFPWECMDFSPPAGWVAPPLKKQLTGAPVQGAATPPIVAPDTSAPEVVVTSAPSAPVVIPPAPGDHPAVLAGYAGGDLAAVGQAIALVRELVTKGGGKLPSWQKANANALTRSLPPINNATLNLLATGLTGAVTPT